MRGTEIDEPGAVFVKRYVLSTLVIEQDSVHAIEYAFVEAVCPIASVPGHDCPSWG